MAAERESDGMLTTSEVARLLNVHINTIRRWSDTGLIKTYRIGTRGDRRFMREDIDLFLADAHVNIRAPLINPATDDRK